MAVTCIALLLTCLAVFPAVTDASLARPGQVDAAEVAQSKMSETYLQGNGTLLQQRWDDQHGPIEWVKSWFSSDGSDSLNASGSAQLAVSGSSAGKDSAGSSVKGNVIAIPLQSQLLQRSPAFRAPRNSSAIELADHERKGHHDGHASGAVIKVKLQSQLLQRKSTPTSREEQRHVADRSTFLAARSTVEHDAAAEKSSLDSELETLMERCKTCMWLGIGLLVACCCFSGAAHSTLGQLMGGFFNCILPLGVIIYTCFMTSLFSDYWHGKPICGWCHAICIWAFIQITCGMCYLGCSVLGVGVAATMGHKTMEEKKVLKD